MTQSSSQFYIFGDIMTNLQKKQSFCAKQLGKKLEGFDFKHLKA